MNLLFSSLAWCALQVTLVTLVAWFLCIVARRVSPRNDSLVPATALLSILVLTALAFAPLPASWSYGLQWTLATTASVPATADESSTPASQVHSDRDLVADKGNAATPIVNLVDETPLDAVATPDEPLSATLSDSRSANPARANSTPHSGTWNWQSLALLALSGWACVGLLQLVGGLLAARSYRRASRQVHDQRFLELVDVLCAELHCTAHIELRESSSLTTAATIGWRRPLILLPLDWRSWNAEQQRAVLAHEIAHVARHDFLACVLGQASLALHFYHPLVHWLVHRLRLEQELAADALAATVVGGERSYLQTLAELALRQSERPLGWPARTFLPTQGTFMRRIEMLRDAKQGAAGRHGVWPRWLAVAVLVVGAVAAAGLRGAGGPASSQILAQDPNPKNPGAANKDEDTQTPRINLAHVPNDAVLFAAIRPNQLLKHPELAEVFTKLDKSLLHLEEAGIAISKLEQVTAVFRSSNGHGAVLAIVESSEPVDFAKIAKILVGHGNDIPEYKPDVSGPTFSRLTDTVAVIGPADDIGAYLVGKRGDPAVAESEAWKKVRSRPVVAAIDMRLERTQPDFQQLSELESDPGFGVILPILNETETIAIGVAVDQQIQVLVATDCLGKAGADQVKESVPGAAVTVRNLLRAQRSARKPSAVAGSEPDSLRTLLDAVDKALSNVKVELDGTLVTAQTSLELKVRGVSTVGSLVPSVSRARTAASKTVSANNIKQIMLAMHNYAGAFQGFPPAAGKGPHGKNKYPSSWRVQLLPHLGHEALYNAYKFDEPWDSESNKKILAQMPAVFRGPGDDAGSTTSAYYVVIGKAADAKTEAKPDELPPGNGKGITVDVNLPTIFSKQGGQASITFAEILDGTSNTIAIVEAKREIPWTKPEDITFDPQGKPPELGGYFADGFFVGMGDGTVNFLLPNIAPESLRAYLTPAKGDPIPPIKGPSPARPFSPPLKK